ncbi:hypothetical protein [Melghirimyces thermohalophilus]|uniref:hypothetical protein n=1 Tax=Melghirimyces thermohalophilus TaxID=1236220 RepID=UPI001FDF028F|nr:hypothetical protein [Melghirimyces thermohalophilus]
MSIRGDQRLITLANLLGEEFGTPIRWMFLIAFWSAAYTSLLGVVERGSLPLRRFHQDHP